MREDCDLWESNNRLYFSYLRIRNFTEYIFSPLSYLLCRHNFGFLQNIVSILFLVVYDIPSGYFIKSRISTFLKRYITAEDKRTKKKQVMDDLELFSECNVSNLTDQIQCPEFDIYKNNYLDRILCRRQHHGRVNPLNNYMLTIHKSLT